MKDVGGAVLRVSQAHTRLQSQLQFQSSRLQSQDFSVHFQLKIVETRPALEKARFSLTPPVKEPNQPKQRGHTVRMPP